MNMKIHHYGLATRDFDQTVNVFKSLGYHVSERVEDPIQKVALAFVQCQGHCIEIVCDLDAQGPTGAMVKKNGSGLYHICYEVERLEAKIEELQTQGFLLRHEPVPAAAFNGRRIAWLYHVYLGLIELLEK